MMPAFTHVVPHLRPFRSRDPRQWSRPKRGMASVTTAAAGTDAGSTRGEATHDSAVV
jgi:hypothetical protein